MPIMRCTVNGKPGFKFGAQGTCYTYTPGSATSRQRARAKAARQAIAIAADLERRGDAAGAQRIRAELSRE